MVCDLVTMQPWNQIEQMLFYIIWCYTVYQQNTLLKLSWFPWTDSVNHFKCLNICLFIFIRYYLQWKITKYTVITGTKQWKTLKEKITPIDDDGAKMHCSLANSVLAPWESTVNSQSMSHWCRSQTISQLDSRWF